MNPVTNSTFHRSLKPAYHRGATSSGDGFNQSPSPVKRLEIDHVRLGLFLIISDMSNLNAVKS